MGLEIKKAFINAERLGGLEAMTEGSIIRHAVTGQRFVVTGNYGRRVTAVAHADVTNPIEWEILITMPK